MGAFCRIDTYACDVGEDHCMYGTGLRMIEAKKGMPTSEQDNPETILPTWLLAKPNCLEKVLLSAVCRCHAFVLTEK